MKDGYIKLQRKLFESAFWLNEPFTMGQAWVDLIAMANYADNDHFYKGTFQRVKRGQIATSKKMLAERWRWSEGKVRRYLSNLERAQMVHIHSTTNGTLITIEKYAFYQDSRRTNGQTDGEQTASKRRADGEQTATKKEINKNKGNGIYIPTRGEIAAYIADAGLSVDPDAVFDYYESIGWEINGKPIKDWRAVCRRWKNYEKEERNELSLFERIDRAALISEKISEALNDA